MDILRQYTIPWKGLKNGKHHFDFEVGKSFFNAFEDSDIHGGDADVSIELDKTGTMLMLAFRITGEVKVDCDRCLEEITLPVDYTGDLKVKFSNDITDYDGDVMWINPADAEVELGQYIYESILLSLPYQKVHGEDEDGNLLCDPQMLAKFRIVSQEEFDELTADVETIEDSPEAEKLKALKDKLEKEETEE